MRRVTWAVIVVGAAASAVVPAADVSRDRPSVPAAPRPPTAAERRVQAATTAARSCKADPAEIPVGDIGSDKSTISSGDQHIASRCDAKCDAISATRVDVLARAVLLVAGMAIPETAREAVLARVTAELANDSEQRPPTFARARESTGGLKRTLTPRPG